MKQWGMGAALMLAAAVASPAAAQQASTAQFAIGAVGYTLPIPAGYCLPTTPFDLERMQFAANLDSQNMTDVSLVSCGAQADPTSYYLIKTPHALTDVPITLPALMAQLGPQFDAQVSAGDPDLEKRMGDALSERTNKKLDVDIAATPRGHDDVCGYITGVVQAKGSDTRAVSYATCVTSVGDRLIAVNVYAAGSDPAVATRLLPRARAVAASIRVKR